MSSKNIWIRCFPNSCFSFHIFLRFPWQAIIRESSSQTKPGTSVTDRLTSTGATLPLFLLAEGNAPSLSLFDLNYSSCPYSCTFPFILSDARQFTHYLCLLHWSPSLLHRAMDTVSMWIWRQTSFIMTTSAVQLLVVYVLEKVNLQTHRAL